MRVLVVEDNRDTRETLADILRMEEHEVDGTGSGTDAINMAIACPYDVVLSDIGLDGCDGWTVAKLIHRRNPATRIYLLTGWSNLTSSKAATDTPGVRGVYMKPYSLDLVLDLVAGKEIGTR